MAVTRLMSLLCVLLIVAPWKALSQSCPEGDVRLVGGTINGTTEHIEGRVDVCIGGVWGTVTDDGWNSREGRVVCRQLGFSDRYLLSWPGLYYIPGYSLPIHLDNINCVGTEQKLVNCPASTNTQFDNHNEDAGVRCFPINGTSGGVCNTGDIQLADSNHNQPQGGRIEVCMGGIWGTVVDDGWNARDAKVVCRHLGYRGEFGLPYFNAWPYGQGTGHLWIDNINCPTGLEETIWDCFYQGARYDNHNEDAGVLCFSQLNYPNCELGELRVVNGPNNRTGRVEICLNGEWGTIIDDGWGTNDAKVACRQLGFAAFGAVARGNAAYGQGTGPKWISDVSCGGKEDKIINCVGMNGNTNGDSHAEDAGVICNTKECENGDVRLVNGTIPSEGRVELCLEERWTTVCDKGWTVADAQVVCNQLGYGTNNSRAYLDSHFGGNTNLPVRVDDINCGGSEANLIQCWYSLYILDSSCTTTTHLNDAGVACLEGTECTNGDVRLVGGMVPSEGRVEVCLKGVWGTIADDGFSNHDAAMVCKQLGYFPNYATPLGNAFFGQGSGVIHMDSVECRGTERRLVDCTYRAADAYDYHSEDVGVRCLVAGNCTEGEVRLVGGANDMQGRVEICYQGVWGTVVDDRWSGRNAQVVCRQLGYYDGFALPYERAFFGQGSGPIAMDETQCTGQETMLINCTHQAPRYDYHSEDAGVRCFPIPPAPAACELGSLRLAGGAVNATTGLLEICIDGMWGSFCDDQWSNDDANVACFQMGFAGTGATRITGGAAGQSAGPIWVTNAYCNTFRGDRSIADCNFDANTNNCNHNEDSGVTCPPRLCVEGAVRLVGGSVAEEGRLEVCYRGIWGTVCSQSWGVNDARVVCNQLGYSTETVFAYNGMTYGSGVGNIWLTNVGCNGSEASFLDCPSDSGLFTSCTHAMDAGVKCIAGNNCTHGEVRLVGGDADCDEGLVEVCLNGHWGSVNYDEWGTEEAAVVCKQLGFLADVGTPARGSNYASASGQILMTKLKCNGDEDNLVNCPFQADTTGLSHAWDAGVKCYQERSCSTGDVRLNGGASTPNSISGRAEICLGGKWGTIADKSWNTNAAAVVCRQLGYASGSNMANTYTGCAPIYLHSAKCVGNEEKIEDCVLDSDTSEDTHDDDVGVLCFQKLPPPSSTVPPTMASSTPVVVRTSPTPSIAAPTSGRLEFEQMPFIIGSAAVGGVLLLVVLILFVVIVAACVIKSRKPSALVVKQPPPTVSAIFPDDADNVSNPVYDPSYDQDKV